MDINTNCSFINKIIQDLELNKTVSNLDHALELNGESEFIELNIEMVKNISSMLKELQNLKAMENEGRLKRIPCKPGDSMYGFSNGELKEVEYIDSKIALNFDGIPVSLRFEDIGKLIFLTEEDAIRHHEMTLKNEEPDYGCEKV